MSLCPESGQLYGAVQCYRAEDEASSGQSQCGDLLLLQEPLHHRHPPGLSHLGRQDELLQQRAGGPAGEHAEGGGGGDQPGLGALGEGEDISRQEGFQEVRRGRSVRDPQTN